ncbi:MAG: hypothetical protein MUD02_01025 [Bacteroidales bacterium]|jgi:hypothetical protein|nr:hypothetical protein [Bacteroidales bacterium]
MKKLTLLFSALMMFAFANAQSNKEEVDFYQAAFGMEKKAVVAEFVKVDAAQKDAFWKLYDQYEAERKDLGKKRIDLLEQYANNFQNLSNEFADKWVTEVSDLGKKTDALLASYTAKVKKATNPVVALQFFQVESYILAVIRFSILDEIPFPEVKK